MAEMDFKHNVSEIPKGADLPQYEGGNVKTAISSIPDYQGNISKYGSDTNFLSTIGSTLATQSSHAIAAKLGNELGKNPVGELSPALTDFDKTLRDTYDTQAQATLGLKANELITNSNLDMARAPRITPDLIAKTNQQISIGLQNIFKNAPASVRPHLQYQYEAQRISQGAELTRRMIGEQRTDQKNNADFSAKTNSQNAHSLEISGVDLDKDGNSKAALAAIKAVDKQQDALLANNNTTPEEAQAQKDTVRISQLSGRETRKALIAEKEGKLPEYLNSLADNKDIPHNYRQQVINNTVEYMNMQERLRSQNQNLQSQLMHNRIASGDLPNSSDWANFEQQVGPYKAAQMKFNLIQAMNKNKSEGIGVAELIKNYGDAEAQANAEPKIKNAAFYKNVEYTMQQNPNLTKDQAEVQVAMSAGSTVPVFTQTLKNKLWSGDPAQMDSAAMQINDLKSLHAGHALNGLSDADNALYSLYEAQRNPADPTVGARIATEVSQNQDPAVLKVTQDKWQSLVYNNTQFAKQDVDQWILGKFFNQNRNVFHPFTETRSFDSPFMSTLYAADILNKFKANYEVTRGNEAVATKMTQEYVDANYGQSEINGQKQWTLHPIEKTIGFEGNEGIPIIHKDMIRQMSVPIAKQKEAYDKKASNEYWTMEAPAKKGDPIRMTKHERAEVGTKTKTYDVVIVGSNFDKWDVNIQTEYGPRNLFLENPMLGIMTYTPDRAWIKDEYMGHHKNG